MAISRPDTACVYHRNRAVAERRAAVRACHERAREAHLQLAIQHESALAMQWYLDDLQLK